MVFKLLVFFGSKLKLLSIKSSSEFGGLDGSLSKRIVILEEFSNSDSVSANVILDLSHKWINIVGTTEINVEVDVGRFGS